MKKKVVGKPFLPGKSGNPNGRPKVPAELLEAKKLSKQDFDALLHRFLYMTDEQLHSTLEAPTAHQLEKMVGAIIVQAIHNGCTQRLNFLVERLIGKSNFHADDDRTLNVVVEQPVQPANVGPVFLVEINSGGRFMRSRPREVVDVVATPEPTALQG